MKKDKYFGHKKESYYDFDKDDYGNSKKGFRPTRKRKISRSQLKNLVESGYDLEDIDYLIDEK